MTLRTIQEYKVIPYLEDLADKIISSKEDFDSISLTVTWNLESEPLIFVVLASHLLKLEGFDQLLRLRTVYSVLACTTVNESGRLIGPL